MNVNLKDIILIKQGDSSIMASPLDYVDIEFYNKSKSIIHVLKCEVYDSSKDTVLDTIPINKLLEHPKENSEYQEESCTARVRVGFKTPSPYLVWIFEYESKQYRIGSLWKTIDIDVLEIMNM